MLGMYQASQSLVVVAYSVNRYSSLSNKTENLVHIVQVNLHPVSSKISNAAAGPGAATGQVCCLQRFLGQCVEARCFSLYARTGYMTLFTICVQYQW